MKKKITLPDGTVVKIESKDEEMLNELEANIKNSIKKSEVIDKVERPEKLNL